MITTTAQCPTCKTSQKVEFEGQYTSMPLGECAGCATALCDNCDYFKCTGCDEVYCEDHIIRFDGEQCCPSCAMFWADEAKRKLDRQMVADVILAINRADRGMRRAS
jgi:hypothetical protein